jgi:hypothetical protein
MDLLQELRVALAALWLLQLRPYRASPGSRSEVHVFGLMAPPKHVQ